MLTLKCYKYRQKIQKYGKPKTKKYDKFSHYPMITKQRAKTCRALRNLFNYSPKVEYILYSNFHCKDKLYVRHKQRSFLRYIEMYGNNIV